MGDLVYHPPKPNRSSESFREQRMTAFLVDHTRAGTMCTGSVQYSFVQR